MTLSHSVRTLSLLTLWAGVLWSLPAQGQVRVKDITQLAGEHANQLVGMGLVTGLAGTGGTSESTKRVAIELMQKLGLRSDPQTRALIASAKEKTNNLSVVMVTARLPPHAKPGQVIPVTVSTLDDAKSLNGGVLLPTPLEGHDGNVYVVASGAVTTGGFSFGGQAGNVVKNHPTTGRIPDGGLVEADVPSTILRHGQFCLLLDQPEFETATRIAAAINTLLPGAATVIDPASVTVRVDQWGEGEANTLIARCQNLLVVPDVVARVVINEKTGTVIIGDRVRLSRVAITHGSLIITTNEAPEVSQPAPFSGGETTVVPRTTLGVTEEGARVRVIDETATVGDLAAALNALGVTPRDLSQIFQMLKVSGALHAELVLE